MKGLKSSLYFCGFFYWSVLMFKWKRSSILCFQWKRMLRLCFWCGFIFFEFLHVLFQVGSRSRIRVSPGDTAATLTPSVVPLKEKTSAVNVRLDSPETDGFVTVTVLFIFRVSVCVQTSALSYWSARSSQRR